MNMDDDEYLQPVLTSQEEDNFQKLDTIPYASSALVLGVSVFFPFVKPLDGILEFYSNTQFTNEKIIFFYSFFYF